MLRVLGKLPRELVVAVSGGPDSMAILDFLNNNHKVTAYYFDHGTEFGVEGYRFLKGLLWKEKYSLNCRLYFFLPAKGQIHGRALA